MISSTEWLVTIGILGTVIILDLILAVVRRNKETTPREALGWTFFYVLAAIAFGYLLPHWAPAEYRKEFIAGWLTEYSLSVDNLFVFIILLTSLKIKKESQQLVLLLGIMIAIVLRVILIFLGVALVTRFTWVFFFFGAFLIFTAYKLVNEKENVEDDEAKLVHDRVCSQPGAPLPLKYQPLVRIVLIWSTGAMDLFNRSIKKTASALATVRDLSFPR